MSLDRMAPLRPAVFKALLILALPSACATGLEPDDVAGEGSAGSSGTEAEGGSGTAGSSVIPQAGSGSSSGSSSTAFGGTSSTGGKGGTGAGGTGSGGTAAGGKGGSASGGAGTAGSAAGGSSAGGSGGSSGGACSCAKTQAWVDNTTISWATGDCFTVATATYAYTGTKAQTYANGQCNPSKQEAWCADSGNDYKFMLCP